MTKRDAAERSREWLAAVGLQRAGGNKTGAYSQGMLQRLGFAYGMQCGAALCVLDEPFAGVDPDGRAALTEQLFQSSVGRWCSSAPITRRR